MAIRVYDRSNKLIDKFYYTDFKNWLFEDKEKIYKLKNTSSCRIVCDCSSEDIELVIAKRDDTIYIRNNRNLGEKHNNTCRLYSKYVGDNEHEKGWKFDEDEGILIANIPSELFNGKRTKIDTNKFVKKRNLTIRTSSNGVSEDKVTLLGLMCKLNIKTWDRYIERNNRVPCNIEEFLRQAYGTSNNIKIKRKDTLKSYWYSKGKIKNLRDNEFMFIFMPLIKINKTKSANYYKIELAQFIQGTQKQEFISCTADLLNEAIDSLRNKDIEYENNEFRVIVGGFVKKNSSGYLYFTSLQFMPIINQGLWAESSHEKQIYNTLISNGRVFSKGYEGIEYYNNFVPDIIFRDTKKPYIGEVFGIRNIESYNERKSEKIKFSLSQKDIFDFWYWDVTEAAIPPNFKEKDIYK